MILSLEKKSLKCKLSTNTQNNLSDSAEFSSAPQEEDL